MVHEVYTTKSYRIINENGMRIRPVNIFFFPYLVFFISLDYLSKIFIINVNNLAVITAVLLPIIGLGLRDFIMFTILDSRIKGFDLP